MPSVEKSTIKTPIFAMTQKDKSNVFKNMIKTEKDFQFLRDPLKKKNNKRSKSGKKSRKIANILRSASASTLQQPEKISENLFQLKINLNQI